MLTGYLTHFLILKVIVLVLEAVKLPAEFNSSPSDKKYRFRSTVPALSSPSAVLSSPLHMHAELKRGPSIPEEQMLKKKMFGKHFYC